tara:strand:+ start:285 stop:509 length:225 start_codon:yes stop_codon:yes gene_type:complete
MKNLLYILLTLSSNGKYVWEAWWGIGSGDWWVQDDRLLLHKTSGDGSSFNGPYELSNDDTELSYEVYGFDKESP